LDCRKQRIHERIAGSCRVFEAEDRANDLYEDFERDVERVFNPNMDVFGNYYTSRRSEEENYGGA
jgi:hypothetical protein